MFACSDASTAPVAQRSEALLSDDLRSAVEAGQTTPVIVNLRIAPRDDERLSVAIARTQDALLDKRIAGFSLGRRYKHVPAFAGTASAEAIIALSNEPLVTLVQRDAVGAGELKEAVPAVGGDQVRSMFGLTGQGVRVALLDTGIDTTHPDLADSLVAQHCFTQFDCGAFGTESDSAEDDHGHGSNVAGIIASNGVVSSPGFAPDSELVAIKVNDANDSGQESDWVAGLDWLYDNLGDLKVRLVNLSIGTTALYTGSAADCDRAHPALAAAIKNLTDAGITVFAATGNAGSTSSVAAPACNSGVIAVGAVYDSNAGRQPPLFVGTSYRARWGAGFADCSDAESAFDRIACFTNSNAQMDLLAPGAPIISDSLRGRTEEYWGTSQAAPAAVGVAALMLECNPSLTPEQIKNALIDTGVQVMDTRNGLSFPSVRALAAVRSVCDALDAGAPSGDAGAAQTDAGAGAPRASEAGVVAAQADAAGPTGGTETAHAPGQGTTAGGAAGASLPGQDAASGSLAADAAPDAWRPAADAQDEEDSAEGCALQPVPSRSPAGRLQALFVALLTIAWRLRRRQPRQWPNAATRPATARANPDDDKR